jgi:hypothetical protein
MIINFFLEIGSQVASPHAREGAVTLNTQNTQ